MEVKDFPRMSYADAMKYYGSDKPDIRFDMKFVELTDLVQNKGFKVFDLKLALNNDKKITVAAKDGKIKFF